MPCFDERSSPEYIAKESGKVVSALREILCEACDLVENNIPNGVGVMSPELRKWWIGHKREDATRRARQAEKDKLRAIAVKTVGGLSPSQKEALLAMGVDVRKVK